MIRLASESDFSATPMTESAVRIHGLRKAYGTEMSFLRFYSDGEGALLAIMDGVGILDCPNQMTDEWLTFLLMNPDIKTIHCPEENGQFLMKSGMFSEKQGQVMIFNGDDVQSPPDVNNMPYLPSVYTLLQEYFEGISPFDAWYPDASHRIRHDCSHAACITEGEQVISTAMTVAETESAAIIGQVATHPDYRRKGLAGKCIKSLIAICKGKSLYILPLNENAHHLYEKLGFKDHSSWMELTKQC